MNINGVVSRPRERLLFPGIQFTCDGLITKWIVGAQTRTSGTRMPELQIWRNSGGNIVTKINSSVLIPNELGNSSVHEYTPVHPLMFQDGDMLGVYQPEDSKLIVYYQDNTGPVNYKLSGSMFIRVNQFDYPLVTVNITTGNQYCFI